MRRVIGVVAVLPLLLAGCGESEVVVDRPEVAAVTEVLTSGAPELGGLALPRDQARCVAQVLVDSDVSNGLLDSLVGLGTADEESLADSNLLLETIGEAAAACVTDQSGS